MYWESNDVIKDDGRRQWHTNHSRPALHLRNKILAKSQLVGGKVHGEKFIDDT